MAVIMLGRTAFTSSIKLKTANMHIQACEYCLKMD